MKTLFTAFRGANNTSYQLVSLMNSDSIFLTNSFQGLKKDISSVSDDYRRVYMFGLDKSLTGKVRIELVAQYNGELLKTGFDLPLLTEKLDSCNIEYSVSANPTHYLCNAAYYHMLKRNSDTVFIHIPSIKGMSTDLMNKLIKAFSEV